MLIMLTMVITIWLCQNSDGKWPNRKFVSFALDNSMVTFHMSLPEGRFSYLSHLAYHSLQREDRRSTDEIAIPSGKLA